MAISITAQQVSSYGVGAQTNGLDALNGADKKPAATATAQPQIQVDSVVVGTVNEDALRAINAGSTQDAASTARSTIGNDVSAVRIGAQARLDTASQSVGGTSGAKT
jgi:hypothetical protein